MNGHCFVLLSLKFVLPVLPDRRRVRQSLDDCLDGVGRNSVGESVTLSDVRSVPAVHGVNCVLSVFHTLVSFDLCGHAILECCPNLKSLHFHILLYGGKCLSLSRWRCPCSLQPEQVAVAELYAPATGRLVLFSCLFLYIIYHALRRMSTTILHFAWFF